MMRLDWHRLDSTERRQALARPAEARSAEVRDTVAHILADVRCEGDVALSRLTRQYDGCTLSTFEVDEKEFARAGEAVPEDLKQALERAIERIETFHRAGMSRNVRVETAPGVACERLWRPIERVGLYVPAGSAPLPSTVLMLGVPARLAGCSERILCTPPRADGSVDPVTLYAAREVGIKRVFKLGGAQAIAALALGTEQVPACDKLFGPGNLWVAEAKCQVALASGGPALDLPAGPSEVLVIADASADPACVAADLLSQAEHDPASQVLCLSDSTTLLDVVERAIDAQLESLPRAEIARQSLQNARLLRVASLDEAVAVSNDYAPEHLILNVRTPRELLQRVEHAGSVFLGAFSPEAVGDYCSGTNHVLPTGRHARASSGLAVSDFQKRLTVQELTLPGLEYIGPDTIRLAQAEGLDAHARAVSQRLEAASA
jgi:histidinol dehydrogenase